MTIPDFHGLTGGVYKVRERIHRVIADTRLLAIPALGVEMQKLNHCSVAEAYFTMTETLKPIVIRVAILNLCYFVVEFYFAHRFNSVSLLSDSLDFLEDASVNILIFLAFSLTIIWRKRLSYILALS